MVQTFKKKDYELLAGFRHGLRLFFRFSEEAAANLGLEPQQYQGLLAVKGFPGRDQITIGELADQLQVKHHSAVGLVNRLVGRDLLERKVDTEDRRQVHLHLTAQGEKILQKLTKFHKEELRRFGPQMKAYTRAPHGTPKNK